MLTKPIDVIRDKGFYNHPELPYWDEGVEGSEINLWFNQHDLTLHTVMMDDDADEMFVDAWYEDGLDDCSPWEPTPPSEAAILLTIYYTEEGPCAWFGVPKTTEQRSMA